MVFRRYVSLGAALTLAVTIGFAGMGHMARAEESDPDLPGVEATEEDDSQVEELVEDEEQPPADSLEDSTTDEEGEGETEADHSEEPASDEGDESGEAFDEPEGGEGDAGEQDSEEAEGSEDPDAAESSDDAEDADATEDSDNAEDPEVAEAAEDSEEPSEATGDDEDALTPQVSGSYGNTTWSISNGKLTITAKAGTNGRLPDPDSIDDDYFPWLDAYAKKITSVEFKASGSTYVVPDTCADMFSGCSNLKTVDLRGLDNSEASSFLYMFGGCDKLDVIIVGEYYDITSKGESEYNEAFPANPHDYDSWYSEELDAFVLTNDIRSYLNGQVATYRASVPLSYVGVEVEEPPIYTGKPQKPAPTVTVDWNYAPYDVYGYEENLVAGGDYVVSSYANNVNAGNASMTLKGGTNGVFTGTRTVTFKIYRAHIGLTKVASIPNQTYTGKDIKPEVKLTYEGMTLKKGVDYTVSYSNNRKVGTATVTITGKGNYYDTVKKTFKIVSGKKDLSKAKLTGLEDAVYDGKAHTPKPTVTLDGKVLKEGTDYKLTYKNNTRPGIATVNVAAVASGAYKGKTSGTFIVAFTDVPKSFWGYQKIHEAASYGLIHGYSGSQDGMFGPNDNLTRAQAAVILWNMSGQQAPGSKAKNFSDVSETKYYYQAIRWASSVGVVSGYGNTGKFGPEDLVTRQQLAVMLANYAQKVGGIAVNGSAADYASMSDADEVASWASTAMGWCLKAGVMSGSGGKVNPRGNATRAQTAKMVCNVYDMLGSE